MEYLPELIIHRILSFFTEKEAARTSLVSKSWHSTWLTRPDLDFDEQDYSTTDEFFDVVSRCMKRCVQFNIKIQSFSLSMKNSADPAAKFFIVEALRIGATRLHIRIKDHDTNHYRNFVLPNEVFASEDLVELSVVGGTIDDYPSSVRCSRLQSLTLDQVLVKCNVIAHIISQCPLIEKLSLFDIYETNSYFYYKVYNEKTVGDDCPMVGIPKMHNLRSLALTFLRFKTLFMGDLSLSKFPALRDLTLQCSRGFEEGYNPIRISNHSLEQLNFISESRVVMAEFDVPSIRKFTYKGMAETELSFKSIARKWESSRVSINCYLHEMSWFHALNNFLIRLSLSTKKIYLSLHVYNFAGNFHYDFGGIQGLPKPRVENLMMDTMICVPSAICCALFDGMFRICRPKFITQNLVPELSGGWETNNHFLCRAFVHKTTGKQTVRSFYMFSLDDLKEVSLCISDAITGEWNEVDPLESLLDAPSPTKKQTMRYRIGWK